MLHVLLESSPRRARHLGWAMGSAGGHALLIALAIVATGEEPPRAPDQPEPIRFIPIAPARSAPAPAQRARAAAAGDPALVPLVAPTIIPAEIPPVIAGTAQLPSDPTQYFGSGLPSVTGDSADGRTAIYSERFVEKQAMARPGNPSPRYPEMLRSQRIEGDVLMRFVVDTLGVAEPASLVVIAATHAAFASAVRDALLRSRFLPATIGDRPVRQLVEQRFVFAIQ